LFFAPAFSSFLGASVCAGLPEAATRKHKVVRRRRADKTVSEQEAAQASAKAEKKYWEKSAKMLLTGDVG